MKIKWDRGRFMMVLGPAEFSVVRHAVFSVDAYFVNSEIKTGDIKKTQDLIDRMDDLFNKVANNPSEVGEIEG